MLSLEESCIFWIVITVWDSDLERLGAYHLLSNRFEGGELYAFYVRGMCFVINQYY